jgi:hypothetical protein
VSNLSKGTAVIVTDREPGIAKALKNYFFQTVNMCFAGIKLKETAFYNIVCHS